MRSGLDFDLIYPALFAAHPEALLLVDDCGTIVLANPAITALLGFIGDELAGLPLHTLVPAALLGQTGPQLELQAQRKDGSALMVDVLLNALTELNTPLMLVVMRAAQESSLVKLALRRARYSASIAEIGRLAVDAFDPLSLLRQVPVVAARALEIDTSVLWQLEPNRP